MVLGLCGLLLTACFAGEAPVTPATTNSPATTKPLELPVFGEAGPGKIRVKVTGEVHRPGIYYLKDSAVIADALDAALGKAEFFNWRSSSLHRPTVPVEQWIRLGKKEASLPLKDGDWLSLDHPAD